MRIYGENYGSYQTPVNKKVIRCVNSPYAGSRLQKIHDSSKSTPSIISLVERVSGYPVVASEDVLLTTLAVSLVARGDEQPELS